MTCKTVLGLAALALGLLARPARADDWSQAGKPKVLINAEGILVTMVPLKSRGDQARVALLVEGTHTRLDGTVRLLHVKERGRGADFVVVDARGKEGGVALVSREGWSTTRSFSLSVPGRRDGVAVSYDPRKSEKVDTTRIINRLLLRRAGRAGGRAELEKEAQRALAQAAQAASAACKTTLQAELQSKTFHDPALSTLDVGAACGAALRAIESLCDDEPGRAAVKQKLKTVTCKLGTALAIELRRGTLTFTTALDTPGQQDFVKERLLDAL